MFNSFIIQLKKIIFNRHPLKLQTKLFIAYMLTSEIILIVFAIFFYQYVTPILLSNEVNSVKTINTSFKNEIDGVIEGLDITSSNINYSSLMSDKLDATYNLELNQGNLRSLADLFVTINGTDLKSDQINLYDFKGNAVLVGMLTNTMTVDINTYDWFEETIALDGIKLIGTPFRTTRYSSSTKYPDWFISVYRTYTNPYGKKVGVVETVKRCKSVFKSIISYQKKSNNSLQTYVYNINGKLIFPYDITASDLALLPDYFNSLDHLEKNLYTLNLLTDSRELVVSDTSSYSGFTYISVQPRAATLEPVNKLRTLLLFVVAMIFILSITVSYHLAQNMVKPVKQLKDIIQHLEISTLGEGHNHEFYTSYDELDEVYQAFQYMSHKLKISMNDLIDTRQQEIKSRTLALQSQTNPHFYYNTLSSIIILTENRQQEEVLTLCRYLTQIMRYITDTSSTIVTLKEEIDYVEKYLHCMKVRYQSSLISIIDIDPELLTIMVPKLIIQPLVENAIKYGTDCIPPWTISIIGRIYSDYWQIDVIDSGNGFTEKSLEQIYENIDYVTNNPGIPEMKIDGLGLINVHMRWKLFTKETYIFEIKNTEDGHGMISIGMKL